MASQNPIPPSLFLFLFIILLTTTPLSAARRLSSSPQQPEHDSLHPPTTSTFSLAQQPAAVNNAVSLRKVPAVNNVDSERLWNQTTSITDTNRSALTIQSQLNSIFFISLPHFPSIFNPTVQQEDPILRFNGQTPSLDTIPMNLQTRKTLKKPLSGYVFNNPIFDFNLDSRP
ncbi:unnamed protein product [Citrullus colocynthis]|uniref:Uncharacterized protein n=1 Tax=Citrullus colocynthis TaxID=252529 RepID=A0ABP0XS38_9ROSI